MRCFLAVPVPESCRRRLGTLQAALRARLHGIRWTRLETIHLTLLFLGEIDEALGARLSERLAGRIPGLVPRFRIRVRGVGAFPSARRPRVLWAGLVEEDSAGCARLSRLHDAVRAEAVASGCAPEARAFRPHLTLGRLDRGREARIPEEVLDAHARTDHGAIEVDAVRMYRSVLAPGGAVHTMLAEYAL